MPSFPKTNAETKFSTSRITDSVLFKIIICSDVGYSLTLAVMVIDFIDFIHHNRLWAEYILLQLEVKSKQMFEKLKSKKEKELAKESGGAQFLSCLKARVSMCIL